MTRIREKPERDSRPGFRAPPRGSEIVEIERMDRDGGFRITAVIVDDEELARSILREYLSMHPEVEVVAECSNGFEAVKAVSELKPDLLFLDIQMPKLDGFEVLELIGSAPAVIFVTAYDRYAIRAFDVHAVDYLLKPFTAERLADALARARRQMKRGLPSQADALVRESREAKKPLERILVKDGARVHVIPVDTIDYIEAQDDYAGIRSGSKLYLKQDTMGDLECLLDPGRFIRIHRSYILNIDRLARLEPCAKDSRVAVLTDGTKLPVSRAGYARLKPLL
jgi:two-component system LytT family response regulator